MLPSISGQNEKYNFSDLEVLIVDDNQHMHTILRDILLGMRIKKIKHAYSSSEAMKMVEAGVPDVMLVDLLMKPVSGFDFIRSVRRHERQEISLSAILVLTSFSSAELVRRARDSGANELLCKPVSVSGLVDRLTHMRDHPRQFVKTETYIGPDRRRAVREFEGPDRRKKQH